MSSIRLGFTSVMIDASTLSFADNAAITRKVVDAAHAVGVTVEAELGHVGQGADEMTEELAAKVLTKPDEAVRFVQETGVDALAVSVGTLHGVYRFEPKIRWDLLDELVAKVPAYLVIHGGSGTPGLEKVARVGVTKINIATEIITSCVERLRKEATKPVFEAFQGIQKGTVEAEKEAMVSRIRCFGANGKGRDLLRSI
jgi:fructose-bisphosphate aldolase class II